MCHGHNVEILPTDAAGAPTRWMLIFRRRAKHWWINWLVPGQFKHVCAFGYVWECDAYIFFDAWLGGTSVSVARGASARAMMVQWTKDAVVLTMDVRTFTHSVKIDLRMLCTTAIAHLVGVPGALRPDALYRHCLAHGAQIVVPDGPAEPAAPAT